MKIRPVKAEMFHSDRQTDQQTDLAKLIVALRNFADTYKSHKKYMNKLSGKLMLSIITTVNTTPS